MEPKRTMLASQDGIALLMVLWALTILSAIVFSFTLMARTEVYATASFRAMAANRLLAEAGVERSIMELLYRNANKGQTTVPEGGDPVLVDGTLYAGRMNKGLYTFRITDESGKIPLNALTDATGVVLKNLIVNMGYSQEDADTVVDSILDWMDQDELHRLHGAESEYYMSLPNPYKAKNGPFDTLDELLLVKGVTPAMLYGTHTTKGIISYLTVSTNATTINVNAAPREVLMAVPGMDPAKADVFLLQRQAIQAQDLAAILGEKLPPFLGTTASSVFCIEATGNREGAPVGYGVRAIVSLEGDAGYRYLYYKSPAQVTP